MQKTPVIPTAASAEWRNPPRWVTNQHKIKLATREDSSTHCVSLGMTCRGVVPFNQTGCIRYVASPWRGWSGDESSPLHCTVYWVIPFTGTGYFCHVAGGRLPMELWCDCPRQSINFDSLREAPPLRQCTTFLAFYKTQIDDRAVKNTVLRNKCIVGAAILSRET